MFHQTGIWSWLSIIEIISIFEEKISIPTEILAIDVVKTNSVIDVATRNQILQYNDLCLSGGVRA